MWIYFFDWQFIIDWTTNGGGVRYIKLNKQYERKKLQNIKKNPSVSGSYQFTKEENYSN